MRTSVAVVVVLCLAAGAYAQEKPAPPPAKGVEEAESFITEMKQAPQEFQKATEVIKSGNESMGKGDQDSAYCLFEEGVMRLNRIKDQYPEWEKDTVMKQIKNTLEVKNKLEATHCQNLESMKEANFRFNVWRRQVLILRKLDDGLEILKRMEEVQDKDDEYIKDIRQRLFKHQ